MRAASPVRLRATHVPIVQPGGPLPAAPPVYPQPTPQPTAPPTPLSVMAGVPSLVPGSSAVAPMSAPVMALSVPAHGTEWPGSGVVASVPGPFVAPVRRTPWYKWMLGGLVAVGLGITGAWYVTRDKPTSGHGAAQPTSARAPAIPAPTVAPAEPAAPSIVSVRFDSLPAAHVFAAGHAVELCQTPCAFDVDLKDGGPTDHRAFVVHADGYEDKQVVVDVATPGADRDLHVTLDQIDPKPPVTQPTANGQPATASQHGHPGPRRPTKSTTNPTTPTEPTKPETKPPRVPDATDTLDPFAKP